MAYYASPNNGSNGSSALLLAKSNGSGTASGGTTGTVDGEAGDGWIWDDATWILCASFIIFTMQTGRSWVEITGIRCAFDTVGILNLICLCFGDSAF